MTSLDKQLEELISERNSFEKEVETLKAQVNELRKCLTSEVVDGLLFDMATQSGRLNFYKAKNIVLNKTPEQCLNSVKADAIEEATRKILIAGRDPFKSMMLMADKLRANN